MANVAVGDRPVDDFEAADGVLRIGEGGQRVEQLPQVGVHAAEDLPDRPGVAGDDLGPQARVTCSDPGDVADPLSSQAQGLLVE